MKGEYNILRKVHTTIDVRYQETDQMGVVYHANYLVWFEIGRTKLIEELGFSYTEMEQNNVVSPVTDVHISYKSAIRYGESVTIETWLEKYDGIRSIYGYNVIGENEVVAVTGTTEHVIVTNDTFRPLSLRKTFPDWHAAYNREIEGKS